MGPDGFGTRFAGKKVWFLTPNNQLVERRIVREIVRTAATKIGDYTIVLFDSDLPDTIQPMRVTGSENVFGLRSPRYPYCPGGPNAILKTEQTGHVSADIPGFTVDTWKGGDSGSPNMLPLPGELVFFSGRSTSGPSAAMQADMDELCRLQKLKPARYQLQWVDLSGFPAY
jgi:hypothetical protein